MVEITYELVSDLMQSNTMILYLALVVVLPLIIWIIIGSVVRARTADGRKLKSLMIESPNFWWFLIPWGVIQVALLVLLVFPFWLNLI